MNKTHFESNILNYEEVKKALKVLIKHSLENNNFLSVPKVKNTKEIDKLTSYISEIYFFQKIIFEKAMEKFNKTNIITLLDLIYDVPNRRGFDLLFLEKNTGHLIIGEVKSTSILDKNEAYTKTIQRARLSFLDNDKTSVREGIAKKLRPETVDKEIKVKSLDKCRFIDHGSLGLDEDSINNYRDAINSIIQTSYQENKKTDLSKYKNITLLVASWIKTNSNFNEDEIDKLKKYFLDNFVNKIYENSLSLTFGVSITESEYKNLYNFFYGEYIKNRE
ncbi:hypothetical protein SSABA_v1c04370 [Spiroplasma sabaudiense Ar-1343]|uniref:Uncharacterized protein n=1 Tax=Spiroplasma sabaudiense Ar-1343 TaxID=1276257 RepID=W6AJF0_9MOLU|nr:hypothetical protein [Spiroplasma sabaudiense]AHI53844.1 hypothetical protein SSABA_v1c04370 [Spiroplasma sabaudiense Ar-1343]